MTLTWSTHVNAITSKATKRLYFLKQLTRAGVPCRELLHFYTAVIRPVLEYTAPVWHYAITQAQTQQLESVQKRAIHIIRYSTRGLSYHNALFAVNLPSLQARQEELSNSFFREICNPNSCLNYLLPPRWPLDSEPPLLTPVQHYAPKSTVHLLTTVLVTTNNYPYYNSQHPQLY